MLVLDAISMQPQPLKKKRKVNYEVNVWDTISTVVTTISPINIKIQNYRKVLEQISIVTLHSDLDEKCNEGDKWNASYNWKIYSKEEIVDYVLMWWDNFRARYEDWKKADSKVDKDKNEESRLITIFRGLMTELRRWKRLIRCKESDLDAIETKTIEWINKFVDKWEEANKQYIELERRFISIWNAYASNRMAIVKGSNDNSATYKGQDAKNK